MTKIVYTVTDEAPRLATYSLLPVVEAFCEQAGVVVEKRNISLAHRILAAAGKAPDELAALAELVKRPEALLIKLPNISASIPQAVAAVEELRGRGFELPPYGEETKEMYGKAVGSVVNPVIREGNSLRKIPASVKNYSKKNPHRVAAWSPDSKTRVVSMDVGDFYENEKSTTIDSRSVLTIEFAPASGSPISLKGGRRVGSGDVIDATFMNVAKLREFLRVQLAAAKKSGVLFSVHLKATMMKVSDPIIFGHVVSALLRPVFETHGQVLLEAGVSPNNGLGSLFAAVEKLPEESKGRIIADIEAALASGPELAMIDSARGITGLHTPNGIIIDASMPAAIREGGKMWDRDGKLKDSLLVIPDRCYAGVYDTVVRDCQKNGSLNPATMGSVTNVGLMAFAAEEYGSHATTFEIPGNGVVRVIDESTKTILLEHTVAKGDIWRMCKTSDVAIKDWVQLAETEARETKTPAIFWLDPNRAHDCQIMKKVNAYLGNTGDIDVNIMSPVEAMRETLRRCREGLNTISATGNVLRDYLTDLFPIMEVGTSGKILSIVPLIPGGVLLETGAGGSAPKLVQQLLDEGHLRWDSMGEFLAVAEALRHIGSRYSSPKAAILGDTLEGAIGQLLDNDKGPKPKVGQLDNRGSHFYLALYWAKALAAQDSCPQFKPVFSALAEQLARNETKILEDLAAAQGHKVDIGGYYLPNDELANAAMRPSKVFNDIIASLNG